jgi:hypothetical protein
MDSSAIAARNLYSDKVSWDSALFLLFNTQAGFVIGAILPVGGKASENSVLSGGELKRRQASIVWWLHHEDRL